MNGFKQKGFEYKGVILGGGIRFKGMNIGSDIALGVSDTHVFIRGKKHKYSFYSFVTEKEMVTPPMKYVLDELKTPQDFCNIIAIPIDNVYPCDIWKKCPRYSPIRDINEYHNSIVEYNNSLWYVRFLGISEMMELCNVFTNEEIMIKEVPYITWKNKEYKELIDKYFTINMVNFYFAQKELLLDTDLSTPYSNIDDVMSMIKMYQDNDVKNLEITYEILHRHKGVFRLNPTTQTIKIIHLTPEQENTYVDVSVQHTYFPYIEQIICDRIYESRGVDKNGYPLYLKKKKGKKY